jgi:hypothetical protein
VLLCGGVSLDVWPSVTVPVAGGCVGGWPQGPGLHCGGSVYIRDPN